jgi:hypothetical protein
MTMSKYDTFKNRTSSKTDVLNRKTTEFIENSASSVDATRLSDTSTIKAVIISERKEGPDETILFTYATDALTVGEFIQYRNKTYLLYSEYEVIFSDQFKKHKLLECNVELKWDGHTQKAYYASSLRSYSVLNDQGTSIPYEFSGQKPIIVTKENTNIKPGTRFIILGEGFVVSDMDKISNQGIYYISVEESPVYADIDDVPNDTTITIPAPTNVIAGDEVVSGDELIVATNFAYISFDEDVEIISKSVNSVTVEVPFGIDTLTIYTKDGAGDIVTTQYKVVI